MLDPRLAVVEVRLGAVRRILAVTGGKGGIGKSFVASALAIALQRQGREVGLLDLDLTSPSTHVILGFETAFPAEAFGIEPAIHHGIRCMSIAHFAADVPVPLRGGDTTNALLELLAITRWGDLDVLVVDMPPGSGDAALDAMRLLRRAEYLVVANASRVVLESVKRSVGLLLEQRCPVVGMLENMRRNTSRAVEDLAVLVGARYLGAVGYDEDLEEALGDVDRLAGTAAVRELTAHLEAASLF